MLNYGTYTFTELCRQFCGRGRDNVIKNSGRNVESDRDLERRTKATKGLRQLFLEQELNNLKHEKHSKQGAFSIGNKYSRGVDLSPSTDGVAIAARANNNLVANMKGIVKKANAKFNPFHHEELENLRIDKRDEEKDLNLIEYQFVSPNRKSKKYKVI